MTPPTGTEPNRVKVFHENLSHELTILFEKPRTKVSPFVLLQILAKIT